MEETGDKRLKIDIQSLSFTTHEYEFIVGKKFFQTFENSPIEDSKLEIDAKIEKSERMLIVYFEFKGEFELICDRSLRPFKYPVSRSHKLIFKFGDHEEELEEDVIMIPWEKDQLDLGKYIYEYAVLSIPMKKLHPDFLEEEDDNEDEIMVYSSKNEQINEDSTDPRWEILKDIKTKSNK